MIRRAPGFTALIIFVLAIGMGASLATFSVTDAILLRMLPVRDPASLFRTAHWNGNAYEMQRRSSRLAELIAYRPAELALIRIGGAEPARLMQQMVSGNYFGILGLSAVAGRTISAEDDKEPGQRAAAVKK